MPDPFLSNTEWRVMTATINKVSSPNNFLKNLLFGSTTEQLLGSETVELGSYVGGRTMAPFVRKHGEALLVGGISKEFSTVKTPNIRIKMPFRPENFMNLRLPGTSTYIEDGAKAAAIQKDIALHIQYMFDQITNTEEWMIGQLLSGSITYSNAEEEAFTITLPRAGANSITLSTFWDTGGANARPLSNILQAKAVVSDIPGAEGINITDGIMGAEAADALTSLIEAGHVKVLDMRLVDPGSFNFVQQMTKEGASYIGTFSGVRLWKYGRQATNYAGATVSMIRPKWIEFFNANAATSGRTMYYGAIPDWDLFKNGNPFKGKILSKRWTVPDPSEMFVLAHTRPLPWMRRPNATVSMKVVSG